MKGNLRRVAIALFIVSLMGRSGSLAATKARARNAKPAKVNVAVKSKPAVKTTTTSIATAGSTIVAPPSSIAPACTSTIRIDNSGQLACVSVHYLKAALRGQYQFFDISVDVRNEAGTHRTVMLKSSRIESISSAESAADPTLPVTAHDFALSVDGIDLERSLLWVSEVVENRNQRTFARKYFPILLSKHELSAVEVPTSLVLSSSTPVHWFSCDSDGIAIHDAVRFGDGIGMSTTHFVFSNGTFRKTESDNPTYRFVEQGANCIPGLRVSFLKQTVQSICSQEPTPDEPAIKTVVKGRPTQIWFKSSPDPTELGVFDVSILVLTDYNKFIKLPNLFKTSQPPESVTVNGWGRPGEELLAVVRSESLYLFRLDDCSLRPIVGPGTTSVGTTIAGTQDFFQPGQGSGTTVFASFSCRSDGSTVLVNSSNYKITDDAMVYVGESPDVAQGHSCASVPA